jgi:uncharacterized protein involved in exopolysaccharide biosynthesis
MKNRMTLKTRSLDSNADQSDPFAGVNLFELVSLLLNRRRFIAWSLGAVLVVAIIVLLLMPNQYTSTASILPTGSTDRLAGLKSLAGLGNIVSVDESSSDLFPVILGSRELRRRVLDARYSFEHDGETVSLTLQEYFDQDDPDKLLQAVASIVRISTDKKTGVTRLSVETEYPELSQEVARKYLASLEDFNLTQRRSKGKENAQYLTRELAERRKELARAEDDLEAFQLANQDWQFSGSPEILKELSRLQREVQVKTSVCLLLEKELEMARLDAQKDVPVMSVLDEPSLPTVKSRPYRATWLFVTAAATLFLLVVLVIAHAALTGELAHSRREEYAAFRTELAETFPKTSRIVNRVRGRETVGV